MKKVFCFIFLFCFYGVYSQSPEKFTYQSIVRSSNGAILQSADVGIRLSVLKSSSIGNSVYSEEHSAKTNKNGIITLIIGDGTTFDDFSSIDWSTGTYYLKIEVDPLGGNDYLIESTSQLLSVPYALYSGTSGTSINKLKLKGENYLSLSDNELSANKVDLSSNIKGTLSINSGGTGATDAAGARTALGVDAAGTDNSTAVSLATVTDNYLTITGQEVTAGTVPLSLGGTGATDAAGARTALGVDAAGTDNSTAVSLATIADNYLTITGQEITSSTVPLSLGGTGATDAAGARTALGVDAAGTDNSTAVSLATVTDNYLTITGQEVTAGTVPLTLGGTGATDASGARTALGLGTIAVQGSDAVNIDGGAIDGTTIGTTTPSTGTFSTVSSGTIQSIGDTDITLKTGNAVTGTITITDGTNGNINISPNGTGQVVIDNLTFPSADGANGEVLKTDGSGNLSWTSAGGGRESVTMLSNDDIGIDNFVIDENTYPSGQIFSIDPKDDSTNDIEITLPALTIGLKYTFVVNRDAQSNVYLQISSPSSGKLYGVAYCDDSSAGNITEEISGTTFKIANGYADRGTRIEVFSDGELWHIIAYIPEGCDHVSHT
jgi:hypothetical protein